MDAPGHASDQVPPVASTDAKPGGAPPPVLVVSAGAGAPPRRGRGSGPSSCAAPAPASPRASSAPSGPPRTASGASSASADSAATGSSAGAAVAVVPGPPPLPPHRPAPLGRAKSDAVSADGVCAVEIVPPPLPRLPAEGLQEPPRAALFSPRGAPAAPEARAAAGGAAASAAAAEAPPLPRLYPSNEHPAVTAALAYEAAALADSCGAPLPPPPRPPGWALRSYVLLPLALPLLGAWYVAALLAGFAAAFAVLPSLALARRLYWACPFIPYIWKHGPMRERLGPIGALLARLQFEGAHCITVVGRLLTLPMRPHLPNFYIAGFPKCGTTSLAAYLKLHPDLHGIVGMPGHEALSKESHFLGGLLGPNHAASAALYRSFFPSVIARWWHEVAGGARRWQCFDATPTYACLPHVPARVAALTPNAKVVFMLREPTAALFSAESMLRGMGVPLAWSLARPLASGGDPEAAAGEQAALLQDDPAHAALWRELAELPPGAPLPAGLPEAFYFSAASYLRGAQYAERLADWARHLPAENLLVVDFKRFVAQPEAVVREVLAFLGADGTRYRFRALPPGMATDYRGARMHPATRAAVAARWFAGSNAALARMLGLEGQDALGWGVAAAGGGAAAGAAAAR